MEIKLLDLCCCAGGCSVGYAQAAADLGLGIEITGVDISDQPNYPYYFEKDDAIEFLKREFRYFTHIHASPPCQIYSCSSGRYRNLGREYADILHQLRVAMYETKLPGVIENVPGSPLIKDIELVGGMFGLKVLRRRVFETVNWFCLKPGIVPIRKGAFVRGEIMSVFGNGTLKAKGGGEIQVPGSTIVEKRRNAMGIDWMKDREITQAIPPAYTRYIGNQFFKQ